MNTSNSRLTVKRMLQLGSGFAFLLTLAISLTAYLQFGKSRDDIRDLLEADVVLLHMASEAKADMLILRRFEKDFLLNIGAPEKQGKYLAEHGTEYEEAMKTLGEMKGKVDVAPGMTSANRQQAATLLATLQQYRQDFLKATEQVRANPAITPQEGNTLLAPVKKSVHDFEENLKTMTADINTMFTENTNATIDMAAFTQKLIAAVAAAGLALLLAGAFAMSRAINDAVGRVAEAMAESSGQVHNASSEIASSSQILAEGASEQAASIEETSASLEEISSMAKQNAENAAHANNMMQDATQTIIKTDEVIRQLSGSMAEISQASVETSKVIKTIDEIAFQTNLLALNAAVEAARAGEAGAGFAVVADEVRNLAMRAAEAAKNTAGLIETTITRVNSGSSLMNKAGESFIEVSGSVQRVGNLIAEIAAASSEQTGGISQINKAISEMDEVTQRNAANAEESAAASTELNSQADTLETLVQDLWAILGDTSQHQTLRRPAAVKKTPPRQPSISAQRQRAIATIPYDGNEEFEDFSTAA